MKRADILQFPPTPSRFTHLNPNSSTVSAPPKLHLSSISPHPKKSPSTTRPATFILYDLLHTAFSKQGGQGMERVASCPEKGRCRSALMLPQGFGWTLVESVSPMVSLAQHLPPQGFISDPLCPYRDRGCEWPVPVCPQSSWTYCQGITAKTLWYRASFCHH